MTEIYFEILSVSETEEFLKESKKDLLSKPSSTLINFFKELHRRHYLQFDLIRAFPSYICIKDLLSRGVLHFGSYCIVIWLPIELSEEEYEYLKESLRVEWGINTWVEYKDLNVLKKIEHWLARSFKYLQN